MAAKPGKVKIGGCTHMADKNKGKDKDDYKKK